MSTFTSSLPDGLLNQLEQKAKELKLPKDKLIERALSLYLEHLERAAHIASYKKMAADSDLLAIAEEGMSEYLQQIQKVEDEAG